MKTPFKSLYYCPQTMRGIKLLPQCPELSCRRVSALATRFFSSSSSSPAAANPIVLDKPEKFRPPSHPSRLNARRIPRLYPGPPIPEAEKKAQATRKYPHTFPNKGTRMYWFLTNKYIHLWISLVWFPKPVFSLRHSTPH